MHVPLVRNLYRDRRRTALAILLIYISMRLVGLDFAPARVGAPDAPYALLPAAFSASLSAPLSALVVAVAVAVALSLALGSSMAPNLRWSSEVASVGCLTVCGLMRVFPGGGLDLAGPRSSLGVVLPLSLALIGLAAVLYRGIGALPFPRLRAATFKARAGAKLDIFRLWQGLFPPPACPRDKGDPGTPQINWIIPPRAALLRASQAGTARRCAVRSEILACEPPFHLRLRRVGERCGADPLTTGTCEVFLVELGRRRLVLYRHDVVDIPVAAALIAWLDDTHGRLLDRRLATIECQAHCDDSQPVSLKHGTAFDRSAVDQDGTSLSDPPGRRGAQTSAAHDAV